MSPPMSSLVEGSTDPERVALWKQYYTTHQQVIDHLAMEGASPENLPELLEKFASTAKQLDITPVLDGYNDKTDSPTVVKNQTVNLSSFFPDEHHPLAYEDQIPTFLIIKNFVFKECRFEDGVFYNTEIRNNTFDECKMGHVSTVYGGLYHNRFNNCQSVKNDSPNLGDLPAKNNRFLSLFDSHFVGNTISGGDLTEIYCENTSRRSLGNLNRLKELHLLNRSSHLDGSDPIDLKKERDFDAPGILGNKLENGAVLNRLTLKNAVIFGFDVQDGTIDTTLMVNSHVNDFSSKTGQVAIKNSSLAKLTYNGSDLTMFGSHVDDSKIKPEMKASDFNQNGRIWIGASHITNATLDFPTNKNVFLFECEYSNCVIENAHIVDDPKNPPQDVKDLLKGNLRASIDGHFNSVDPVNTMIEKTGRQTEDRPSAEKSISQAQGVPDAPNLELDLG